MHSTIRSGIADLHVYDIFVFSITFKNRWFLGVFLWVFVLSKYAVILSYGNFVWICYNLYYCLFYVLPCQQHKHRSYTVSRTIVEG